MSGKLKTVGIFVIALIVLTIIIWSLPSFLAPRHLDTADVDTSVFELINDERASRGLPVLLNDEALASIALEWSEHLTETGDLTHGDFDERIASIGYSWYHCGEIIAMYNGLTTSLGRQFVDMWLDSPGHYQIMMTPKSGYMGVGVSKGSQGFFAVVDFRFTEA